MSSKGSETGGSPELDELRLICPAASTAEDHGHTLYILPGLVLPPGATPSPQTALFSPAPHNGYPSRLYFEHQVAGGTTQNWKTFRIIDRNWYACSVNGISGGGTPAQLLIEHLRMYK